MWSSLVTPLLLPGPTTIWCYVPMAQAISKPTVQSCPALMLCMILVLLPNALTQFMPSILWAMVLDLPM